MARVRQILFAMITTYRVENPLLTLAPLAPLLVTEKFQCNTGAVGRRGLVMQRIRSGCQNCISEIGRAHV